MNVVLGAACFIAAVGTSVGCTSSSVGPLTGGPSTQIGYVVSSESHVKLRMENSYSTTVSLLVDKWQLPGKYVVQWNLEGLPSGVYFYVLEQTDRRGQVTVQERKMWLIKS